MPSTIDSETYSHKKTGNRIVRTIIITFGVFLFVYMMLFFAWESSKIATWAKGGIVNTRINGADDTLWTFASVDSSDFIGAQVPAANDTIFAINDTLVTSEDFASIISRTAKPGESWRVRYRHFGRMRETTLFYHAIRANELLPFVFLQVLRFFIVFAFIGVGMWGYLRRSDSGAVRALTFFCFSMTSLILVTVSIFSSSQAQFILPYYEQISTVLYIFSTFIGAIWLNLHLVFPRRSSFIRRYKHWGYIAIYLPQSLLVVARITEGLNDGLISRLHLIVTLLQFFIGFALLIRHHAKARTVLERRQTRIVLYGSAAGIFALFALMIIGSFMESWFTTLTLPQQLTIINSVFLMMLLTPISFAYAIGKYRLMEVEGKLRSGTRHVAVTVALIVVFFLFVYLFGELLLRNMGITSRTPTLIVALLLGFGMTPAQRFIQRMIDRRFFPERHQLRLMIDDFRERMGAIVNRDMLWEQLAIRLREAVGVERIVVVLREADGVFKTHEGTITPFRDDSDLIKHLEKNERPVPMDEAMASLRIPFSEGQVIWVRRWRVQLVLPLFARGRLIGFLGIGCTVRGREYTPEEIDVLNSLTTPLAMTSENLRLLEDNLEKSRLERELQMARSIQEGFLPRQIPDTPGLHVAAKSRFSLEVAGDYYDVINLKDGKTVIAVGDVSGKGAGAALIMANLQASLRTAVKAGVDLAEVVAEINNLIWHNTPVEQYITFFVGVYDPEEQALCYVNAGHNPPLLISRSNEIRELEVGGMILGAVPEMEYELGITKLSKGDRLLLYTDGVSEAMNVKGEEFGVERIEKMLVDNGMEDCKEMLDSIEHEVVKFHGKRALEDDCTLLMAAVEE